MPVQPGAAPSRRHGAKLAQPGGAGLVDAGLQHGMPAPEAPAGDDSLPSDHGGFASVDR